MAESDRQIVAALAAGRIPAEIPSDCELGPELRALVAHQEDVQRLALAIGRGELALPGQVTSRGSIVGSLKTLQANLRHLTWQTQRIAAGDLSQHVDFLGDFSSAFNEMVRQLTERKRLEAQLRQSQKLEAVGQLAGGLAHEINTPAQFVSDNLHFLEEAMRDLFSLLGEYRAALAEVAEEPRYAATVARLREAEEDADVEFVEGRAPKAFEAAIQGVARIAGIVGAMKEFARPDQVEKSPADLNRALEATLTVARNQYKDVAGVERDFGELPLVTCHVGELNQAFLNLLTNAAQAIEDAGRSGSGRIGVRTRLEHGSVRIDISDDGCGISPAIAERVFEPFFTTREVGRGTGQGLATARCIVVDKHGGTLTFESRVGEGTTFSVLIPVLPPQSIASSPSGA